jgi:4,5-DOPA dioxygenase extradiol
MAIETSPAHRGAAPALFISHGAPTFALEPGLLGPQLTKLGGQLNGLAAVLVVSPHWQTPGIRVMTTATPETIHDFGGFPRALYEMRYAARGEPAIAAEAALLLREAGFDVALDEKRGLDHGTWVPLRYLLPRANVPVFQVSMPVDLDPAGAFRLGHALAPLRARGVLVMGSGSLTHNLYEFRQDAVEDAKYAQEFALWVADAVIARAADRLADYRRLAPHARRAHPTDEHFLPLLVAMGASSEAEIPRRIEGGMTYGTLSMDSYGWGLPQSMTMEGE